MPLVGLGTWPMVGDEAREVAGVAIEAGYRSLDTSEQYGNEDAVGAAVRESGVPREDLFVSTKLNAKWHGEDLVAEALDASLERLGLGYVDLFLIHWPNPWQGRYVDAWRGMLRLREEGRARAVGVSNFLPVHIDTLLEATGIAPEVNQIELDPTLPRDEWRAYHREHGIHTVGWSPLGRGGDLLADPVVVELARRHGKVPAQVILRWQIEAGAGFVARSTNPERIAHNIDLFDFELGAEGMRALAALDRGREPARDPETHGH
jgi:2,5-diketo-D-gluconate reductase A